MSRKYGASNVEATDSETVASLLDPACGIPPDIHFEIEDNEGTSLGILGGHRTIMALKSPVFKAMLYGPLKETGDQIRIKNSSMKAFQTMLTYIHDGEMDWEFEDLDLIQGLKEVFHIADLAERYNLPGLKQKTIEYAEDFRYPEEKLFEVASLAEQSAVYKEVSNALHKNCVDYLTATIETPEHLNAFMDKLSKEEANGVALRLLARVDFGKMAFIGHTPGLPRRQEIISHMRNIDIGIQPRHRIQKLKGIIEEDVPDKDEARKRILNCIDEHGDDEDVFIKSLKFCQKLDAKKAALEGVPLKLDTLVEDHFTHEESVRLHLGMISDIVSDTSYCWARSDVQMIWDEMLKSIHEVKPIFMAWFRDNSEIFDKDGHYCLANMLTSCDDEIKKVPGYTEACAVSDYYQGNY